MIDTRRFIAGRITISMVQFYEVELYYYHPNKIGIRSCLLSRKRKREGNEFQTAFSQFQVSLNKNKSGKK